MPSPTPILRMKNSSEKILRLISVLRGARGCAWDRRQTPRTLAPLLIEEAHEVVEAIERGKSAAVREELGDLLFLVLSIAHAAESKGMLTYRGIVRTTAEKYISRHPHVFKAKRDLTPGQILDQWERQKAQKSRRHPMDGIPVSLPALYQAKRIYEKASRLGMIRIRKSKTRRSARRIGRRLLKAVRTALENGVDPERALRSELRKLRDGFRKVPGSPGRGN